MLQDQPSGVLSGRICLLPVLASKINVYLIFHFAFETLQASWPGFCFPCFTSHFIDAAVEPLHDLAIVSLFLKFLLRLCESAVQHMKRAWPASQWQLCTQLGTMDRSVTLQHPEVSGSFSTICGFKKKTI